MAGSIVVSVYVDMCFDSAVSTQNMVWLVFREKCGKEYELDSRRKQGYSCVNKKGSRKVNGLVWPSSALQDNHVMFLGRKELHGRLLYGQQTPEFAHGITSGVSSVANWHSW